MQLRVKEGEKVICLLLSNQMVVPLQVQPFLLCVKKDRMFSKTTITIYRKIMVDTTKRNYRCSIKFLVKFVQTSF